MSDKTHVCRCGHDRDDHQSRTWQEDGLKHYGEVCEHCPCRSYTDANGPLSQLLDSMKPSGYAATGVAQLRDTIDAQRQDLARLRADLAHLTEQRDRLREALEGLFDASRLPATCAHGYEPDYCDGCRYEMELASRLARIHAGDTLASCTPSPDQKET